MMNTVVTLIGATKIDTECINAIETALETTVEWLADGIACDAPTMWSVGEAEERVRAVLKEAPVDVVAQPTEGRRKRLLVADMESTIIENEMLDELADELGLREKIGAITVRAMRGELDFEGAIRERVQMLAGLEAAALNRSEAKIRIMPGAPELVATMRAHGAYCALVSGGFEYYTAKVRARLGFDYDQANRLEVRDGALTGEVLTPILGRDAKRAALERLARQQGGTVAEAITVGDGANDLDMLVAAGIGVAYHAKSVVAEAAMARIDHGDLTALLYIQGYCRADFRS